MIRRSLLSSLIFLTLVGCTPQPLTQQSDVLPTLHLSQLLPEQTIEILVDDFSPQPYQGDTVYFYNRLEGDRGSLNNSQIEWGDGLATVTISDGQAWGGLWMSLNHPIREGQSFDFSAILPAQILPQYQGRITGMTISIAGGTASKAFRAELKDSTNNLQWSRELVLSGERQTMRVDLPPLNQISQLVLVLDHVAAGDFVVIDEISLTAATPVIDTATAAFVWSYGMLLNNWNPTTGLVRDKARDASGEFDAVQATGSLAAATALAEQIGVIGREEAIGIVNQISDTLLHQLPRNHGLWPHWVKDASGGNFEIVDGTEWSSVDTVIAALGLLDSEYSLGLDTSATEQMLSEIEWDLLVTDKGISHGYTFDNNLIPYAWDVFGGESWLVELAYASATGKVAPLAYPSGPTANGSGFIDELAWLYVQPPASLDVWGTDWTAYRQASVEKQQSYYASENASSCLAQSGLYGLSAAEVPAPARVPKGSIYQAFGLGGQFAGANDGADLLGSPVVAPHYSALIASLRPEAAIQMWDWLITNGYFSPLNNVESLAFTGSGNCDPENLEWNHLKGSWNLSLQTLGWGRYLAEREGLTPAVWQATQANPFLSRGYGLLSSPEKVNDVPVVWSNETLADLMKSKNHPCDFSGVLWLGIARNLSL